MIIAHYFSFVKFGLDIPTMAWYNKNYTGELVNELRGRCELRPFNLSG